MESSAPERRGLLAASAVVIASVSALTLAELGDYSVKLLLPVVILVVGFVILHRRLLAWRSLVGLIILVILFVPIRRYTLPSGLPFHLEPYRVIVALVCVAWVSSLLIDPRVRLSRSPFDAPLFAYCAIIIVSLLANRARFTSVEQDVIKSLLFFTSFFMVFFFISSAVRGKGDLNFLIRLLVRGATIVAALALVESYTGYNAFDHLRQVAPFLQQTGEAATQDRGARLRVFGSAQDPIALSCALTMVVPLAVYLAIDSHRRRWWLAAVVLGLGGLAAISRTDLTMLLAIAVVYVVLRPNHMKRLWPAVIPLLLAVHFALPGAIGSFKNSLFPKGGLLAEEAQNSVGSGRLATAGPVLRIEFRSHPLLGEGFATRITKPDEVVKTPNAPILDDQALGVLLETGVVGAFSIAWLFVRAVRRTARAARTDFSSRGWLLTGLAASIAGYGVTMFTYDSFAFIQVTFILFILLAFAAIALRLEPFRDGEPAAPRPLRGADRHPRRRLTSSGLTQGRPRPGGAHA